MAEFTRISLRGALENALVAHKQAEQALTRLGAHGGSPATEQLASACAHLADGIHQLHTVDEYIQKKAGLLPSQTAGPPAE